MAFRTVVVTKHCKINFKMNLVILTTNEDTFQIPIADVDVLLIETTQAYISAYVIMELLKQNVKIIFSDNHGLPIGEINAYGGNSSRNSNIKAQTNWGNTSKNGLWQQVMINKITNQSRLLAEFEKDNQGLLKLVGEVEIGDQTNREAVAARMYFSRLFGDGFVRRADDEINAKLNYGYQILLAAVAREIRANGLLTEIGIHHDNAKNEYNLASDLMEPFRPLVDRVVKLHETDEFDLEMKLALVDVLNMSVRVNGHEAIVTSAISEICRQAFDYLNGVSELPNWQVEV